MLVYRYGTTWGDIGRTPPRQAWQAIRALRHRPPALAGRDPDRARLFAAALEQSEQFFRAASSVGPQVRGLLLFYGLAQAGRAVRAAQQHDDTWARDGGHGLTVEGETAKESFSQCVVRSDRGMTPRGAFVWVAQTLNRSALPVGQCVGDLSRLLWPQSRFPLSGAEPTHPSLRLEVVTTRQPLTHPTVLHADLIVPAAAWEVELPEVGERYNSHYDAFRQHVMCQLSYYPTLNGARLYEPSLGHFSLGSYSADMRRLALCWPDLPSPTSDDEPALHRFSDEVGRHVQVWPSGPDPAADRSHGSALATHPFLLWWGVLFAMAHYVRYEPATWARLVDVNASPEAVPIEQIGERALTDLPELIHRTLVRSEPQWIPQTETAATRDRYRS